ncbi:MAG: hypothetical protein AAGI52_18335 [Bacteroidota bacterium]
MLRLLPFLLAALVALPACNSLGDDAIGITGTWEGVVFDPATPGTTYPVELRLQDNGQVVTGTGFAEIPGERFEFSVISGSFVNSVVSLDFQYDLPPFKGGLDGTLTETSPGRIEGTFQGRGAANGRVDLELVDR